MYVLYLLIGETIPNLQICKCSDYSEFTDVEITGKEEDNEEAKRLIDEAVSGVSGKLAYFAPWQNFSSQSLAYVYSTQHFCKFC